MIESTDYFDFLIMSSICYLFLLQLSGSIPYGRRIACYYGFHNILTVGVFEKSFELKSKKARILVKIAIIAIGLAYWFHFYAYKNSSQTYPYMIGLGIF